jgi:hypothetical protein
MLADLALSGSAQKVHIYNLIMTNPAPLLKQNTEAGHYNCGDVSGAYGKKLFDKPTSVSNYAYYLTPTSDVMADLRFDPGTLKLRIAHIKALINQGISVRVWLVHDDGFSTHIVASDPTHYVTIVGYSESKFLILDPWPGGSAFKYSGGMYPSRDIGYIGQLEFDPHRLELGIRNSPESEGSMKYTVVGGPP